MPDAAQSLYFFGTLLGGVFVPLIFFVAVKHAVDCAFNQLEAWGLWREGPAGEEGVEGGGTAVPPPAVGRDGIGQDHTRHHNVLVDGIVLNGAQLGDRNAAVTGYAVASEPRGLRHPNERQQRRMHTCVTQQEPLRDAPIRGANHAGMVERGDQFEVLDITTDSNGTDRLRVRLESGKVGWIRAQTAAAAAAAAATGPFDVEDGPDGDGVAQVKNPPSSPPRELVASTVTVVTGAAQPAAAGQRADGLVTVHRWLAARGWDGMAVAGGVCAAFDEAGVPPAEWEMELLGMEADGQLQRWIDLVLQHAADDGEAAAPGDDAAGDAAAGGAAAAAAAAERSSGGGSGSGGEEVDDL